MNVIVDLSKVNEAFKQMVIKSEDGRTVLNAIALFHLRQVSRTFQMQGQRDGHKAWKPFADQYTRITDGITVKAWGKVKKIRGKGMVKGRLRPSGKRITESSKLLQDTGHLRNSFQKQLLEQKKVIYGSVLSYSGSHQYGEGKTPKREMIFFTDSDIDAIKGITHNYLINHVMKVGKNA
jgi:phage gpG-like protein